MKSEDYDTGYDPDYGDPDSRLRELLLLVSLFLCLQC